MDWCRIVEILNALAQPVLAVFSVALFWATVALGRSTKRYAKAGEELAEIERSSFVEKVWSATHDPVAGRCEIIKADLTNSKTVPWREEDQAKWEEIHPRLDEAFRESTMQVLDRVLEETSRSDTE